MAFKKMRPRKKVCIFCKNKNLVIDYKDVETLKRFVSPNGKISPRRVTGACAKHQRGVEQAIKNARIMALLPFIAD
jgi:small subunit ribosomal protein S18